MNRKRLNRVNVAVHSGLTTVFIFRKDEGGNMHYESYHGMDEFKNQRLLRRASNLQEMLIRVQSQKCKHCNGQGLRITEETDKCGFCFGKDICPRCGICHREPALLHDELAWSEMEDAHCYACGWDVREAIPCPI